MPIATRPDKPSANHHGERSSDTGEGTFDVLFHVNCPKCYHMHKHVQLRVHKNPKIFTRFDCQHCHHRIAGIGRNETQSSFASTETQSLEACYGRPSRLWSPQSCINADQLNGLPVGVEEVDSTVLSSPSSSKRPEPRLPPHQDLHIHNTDERSQASVRNDYSLQAAPSATLKPPSTIKLRLILKLEQGRIRLLKKSRNMKLFVFRFWKREETPSPSSVLQASNIREFQPRPHPGDIFVQSQPQDDHSWTPPTEFDWWSSSAAEQLQATALKNERLRQRRREATLRRNAFSGPVVCHCGANCACMRRGSSSSGGVIDAGIDSHSTSRRPTLEQIDDIAERFPSNLLDHIYGSHHQPIYPKGPLDNNVLESLLEESSNTRSQQFRLSQATTIGSGSAGAS